MSDDDELSNSRQWSDRSAEEEQSVNCHFTNPFSGQIYFTKLLNVDYQVSIGFLYQIAKSELGEDAFQLKVGKEVWQSEDFYEKFWKMSSVQDALDESEGNEIIIHVIKVTEKS